MYPQDLFWRPNERVIIEVGADPNGMTHLRVRVHILTLFGADRDFGRMLAPPHTYKNAALRREMGSDCTLTVVCGDVSESIGIQVYCRVHVCHRERTRTDCEEVSRPESKVIYQGDKCLNNL